MSQLFVYVYLDRYYAQSTINYQLQLWFMNLQLRTLYVAVCYDVSMHYELINGVNESFHPPVK